MVRRQPPVFDLYAYALKHIGIRPTVYERDYNIPPFKNILNQAEKIRIIQNQFIHDNAYV